VSMKSEIALDHGSSIPRPLAFSGSCEMSRVRWGMSGRVKSFARKDSMIWLVADLRGPFQSV
jgi:hypothetical protein